MSIYASSTLSIVGECVMDSAGLPDSQKQVIVLPTSRSYRSYIFKLLLKTISSLTDNFITMSSQFGRAQGLVYTESLSGPTRPPHSATVLRLILPNQKLRSRNGLDKEMD